MKPKRTIQNMKRGRPRGPASMSAAAKHRSAGLHSALPGKRNGDAEVPMMTGEERAAYLAMVQRAQDAKTSLAESKARAAKREEALAAGDMVTRDQAERWFKCFFTLLRHEIDRAPIYIEELDLPPEVKAPALKALAEVCRRLRVSIGNVKVPPMDFEAVGGGDGKA